jgi:succinate dehydrogenase flavin-adding protein (antitoxin of CptAB toxin-antitoxin module)
MDTIKPDIDIKLNQKDGDAIEIFEKKLNIQDNELLDLIYKMKNDSDKLINHMGIELLSFVRNYVDEYLSNE